MSSDPQHDDPKGKSTKPEDTWHEKTRHENTQDENTRHEDTRDDGVPRDAFPEEALPDETGPFNEDVIAPDDVEGKPVGFWERREVYPLIFLIIIGIAYFFMGCDSGEDDFSVSVRVENPRGEPIANAAGTARVTEEVQFVVERPNGTVGVFVRTVEDGSNTFTFVVSS